MDKREMSWWTNFSSKQFFNKNFLGWKPCYFIPMSFQIGFGATNGNKRDNVVAILLHNLVVEQSRWFRWRMIRRDSLKCSHFFVWCQSFSTTLSLYSRGDSSRDDPCNCCSGFLFFDVNPSPQFCGRSFGVIETEDEGLMYQWCLFVPTKL